MSKLIMLKFSSDSIDLIHTLSLLKKKAVRKGIWYRALDNKERVLIIMISRYIKIVRNPKLAYIVAKMISKLLLVLRDTFMRRVINGVEHLALWSERAKRYGWDISDWFESNIISWFGMFGLSFK